MDTEQNMRNSRRMATIGLSVVAVGGLFAGTAAAQTGVTAGTWGGTASADALTISIGGQTLTTSAAAAELRAGLAKASSTQVLTPALTNANSVELTAPGTAEDKPEACTGSDLTAIPGIARFDLTCGLARATLNADGGNALGLGAELVLEPSVSGVLETIQVQGPAQEATTALLEGLNPLVEGLTGTPIGELVGDTQQTLQDVVGDLLTLKSTARIVVAPALAEVSADADKVVAKARAQGVRIELLAADATAATNGLLPDDLDVNEPLVTITIGDANVSKTVPKNGGEGEVTHQASLVTVEFGSTALTESLGLAAEPIRVEAGQTLCIPGLEGTPLETCVTVANAGVDANGNPFADGTSVQLFKGVSGGIDLAVGRAGSGGEATAGAPVAAPAPAGELPRTGGPATLPLVGGALLALAAGARRLASGRR